MSEKMTTDDLVFVLLAKLPSGAIHQVHVSQDKIQENLLHLIDGDSLQLYQDPIDTLSIIKNAKDDKEQNTVSGEDSSQV